MSATQQFGTACHSVSEYMQNWIPQGMELLLLLVLESSLRFYTLTHNTCPSITSWHKAVDTDLLPKDPVLNTEHVLLRCCCRGMHPYSRPVSSRLRVSSGGAPGVVVGAGVGALRVRHS